MNLLFCLLAWLDVAQKKAPESSEAIFEVGFWAEFTAAGR